jgi:hypothetical protein
MLTLSQVMPEGRPLHWAALRLLPGCAEPVRSTKQASRVRLIIDATSLQSGDIDNPVRLAILARAPITPKTVLSYPERRRTLMSGSAEGAGTLFPSAPGYGALIRTESDR